jgi:hypothetical protein
MESQLQRVSAPRVGKIDFDTLGGVAGNWFLKGYNGYSCNDFSLYENASSMVNVNSNPDKTFYAWCHLAIAPHNVDPSAWEFSIGWWKNSAGESVQALITIANNQPAPNQITPQSGTVVYRLAQIGIAEPAGTPAKIGEAAPFAVGYKVTEGSTIGYLAIRAELNGTISLEISDSMNAPSGLSNSPRVYTR